MADHLWLIGMMGAGKSSAARRLATCLERPYVDIDDTIAARMGCSIAHLWGERGEAAFREMERAAVNEAATGPPAVIATGGGVVLDPGNVATMRGSGRVVWLRGRVDSLVARVGSGATRPLLADQDPAAKLAQVFEERAALYAAAADHGLDTDDLSTADVVRRIEVWWNES